MAVFRKVTFSVTEDGIQIDTGGPEDAEPGQTGTVTTNGGRLNVRTGAGLDHTAFTQLPNGTAVEVVGEDGDWLKIILPERVGYVHSDYMTVSNAETDTDGGGLSFSLAPEELETLLGMFGGLTGLLRCLPRHPRPRRSGTVLHRGTGRHAGAGASA